MCLEGIVQDDDLRRPKAALWSGSPWGELAPKASEGGGMRNGGQRLPDENPEFLCGKYKNGAAL